MRLSEPFQISEEFLEKAKGHKPVRNVIVGEKSEQSERRLPIPMAVLPLIADQISGPLFLGTEAAASKRLNRFLRKIGIKDKRKVIHSLRHRAKDRLRAEACPQDIRFAILGHERKTVADSYGEGFPMHQVQYWMEKIGW
jgi:hypothetical protein